MICDRLNNSSLEDIRTVTARGHQLISSKIKRATGELEYTLSFSIKINKGENELFSFWNIDQYPAGNYQNFQIWGSSFSQVFTIANFIIDKHTNESGLRSTKVAHKVPNVFVKSGAYANGFLTLNIVNKTRESEAIFDGNISRTEVASLENVTTSIALSGSYEEEITIETGVLFDIGFSIQTNNNHQKDALYLADGPWGLDYLEELATVNDFYIDTNEVVTGENTHHIDRNVSVSGTVKGNINLFRHVLPGDQTLSVTNYEALNFSVTNNHPIEIVLMQQEDRDWSDRIRYTIPANDAETEFSIAFDDFKDASGNKVAITNIKTIVFSVIGNFTNEIPFDVAVKNVSFGSVNRVLSTENSNLNEVVNVMNYPNPFKNTTTIQLPETAQEITIRVFDVMGRVVDVKRVNVAGSTAKYTASNLKTGIYKYRIVNDKNQKFIGSFVIN